MDKTSQSSLAASVVVLNDLQVATDYRDALVKAGLDSLDALFAVRGESLDKLGLDQWRQRIRLKMTVNGDEETFFLKRFTNPPSKVQREIRRCKVQNFLTKADKSIGATEHWDSARAEARGSIVSEVTTAAGLEWTRMWQLDHAGVNGPKPIAMGQALNRGDELRSAVLMKSVTGQSLETWCGQWDDNEYERVKVLIDPLAKLIRRFHDHGFVHRDMYLAHLFFDPQVPIGDALSMIDLQRIIELSSGHTRWIVKDLASLNYSAPGPLVTRTHRLRWLKCYAGVSKLGKAQRQLAYLIIGKTQQIARHDRRRNARLADAAKDGDVT